MRIEVGTECWRGCGKNDGLVGKWRGLCIWRKQDDSLCDEGSNLDCVVRRAERENVEGKCCEAKWTEGCADNNWYGNNKMAQEIAQNERNGAILLTSLDEKWCV